MTRLRGRGGGQGAREQVVEALHGSGAREGRGREGRGREAVEIFDGVVRVHRVDDRLALPVRESLGDVTVSLEQDSQDDHVRLHCFLQRSEEHTSELQSLMRISYAVFCLTKKTTISAKTTSIQYSNYYNNTQKAKYIH